MPSVSVVVPVYNTGIYLHKCLDSLVNQSMEDIEIIVVDDGSTDNSCEIIAEYEKRYPSKLRCLHQENSGISIARNNGLQVASGETVAFIDSDDSVDLRFCECLYKKLSENHLDVAVCDFKEVDEIGKTIREVHLPDFESTSVFQHENLLFDINTSPWNKLYRKSYLEENEIFFPVDVKYEDVPFMQNVFAKGAVLGKVNEQLVFYLVRQGSETTKVNRKVYNIFPVLDLVRGCYEGIDNQEILDYIEYFCVNRISVYNLQQVHQEDRKVVDSFINDGFQYLNRYFPNWRRNKHFAKANGLGKRLIKRYKALTKAYVYACRVFQ